MSDVKVPHSVQRAIDSYAYRCLGDEPPMGLYDAEYADPHTTQEAWYRTLRKIRRALPAVED